MDNQDKSYEIFLSYVEEKYNFIKLDENYMSSIVITEYPKQIEKFDIFDELLTEDNINVCLSVYKQDKYEILKKVVNIIGNANAEIKTINGAQPDIVLINKNRELAKELREKIQVYNEDIYKVSIIINVFDSNLNKLFVKLRKILNILYVKEIFGRVANFRQKQALNSCININENKVKDFLRIGTSSSVASIFPYYDKHINHENGVIVGKVNNEICKLDLFDSSNLNYNMCVFGASGSGKSYFIKSIMIKYLYRGIHQIIVDPEGEYCNIARSLGGEIIDISNYNILYFSERYMVNNKENFLEKKINKVYNHISSGNELAFCSNEIKECIKKAYTEKGLTENLDTYYTNVLEDQKISIKKRYIKYKYFPNFNDVIKQIHKATTIANDEKKRIIGNLKRKDTTSNENESIADNELLIINTMGSINEKNDNNFRIALDIIEENLLEDTIIYFEEVWKIICLDHKFAIKIRDLFKTIRKKRASIVVISQELSDLFKYSNGDLGKSILNNSYIRVLFKMEYKEEEIINSIFKENHLVDTVKKLERGKALASLGITSFEMQTINSKFEHDLIEKGEIQI